MNLVKGYWAPTSRGYILSSKARNWVGNNSLERWEDEEQFGSVNIIKFIVELPKKIERKIFTIIFHVLFIFNLVLFI